MGINQVLEGMKTRKMAIGAKPSNQSFGSKKSLFQEFNEKRALK